MTTILSPSGGDDYPQIQAAINALPTAGGEILLTNGVYQISDSLRLGDGGRRGMVIRGEGAAGWSVARQTPAVTLNWTNAATKAIFEIIGPFEGWGLHNLCLKGNDKAIGINVSGASEGDCSNLQIIFCVRGIALNSIGGDNAMHNSFRNTGIWLPWVDGSSGIVLAGQRNPEGPNSCFNQFENTMIVLAPGAFNNYGVYLQECDTNTFVNTHVTGGAQLGVGVQLDYGVGNGQPGGNLFVGFDAGGVHAQFQNAGTPAVWASPNIVYSFQTGNGGVFPSIANLVGGDADSFVGATVCSRAHVPATGEAGMLLLVNKSGTPTTVQVKVGAANSGGSGKRALVIDN